MHSIVSYVAEQYCSFTCDTIMHVAGFVELESSALGDAVRQYAVLELTRMLLRLL